MSPGNTQTGGVLERMVVPALDHGGYTYEIQVQVGKRLGCGRHFVDAVVAKDGRQFLVSVKWQQVSGTAEQKVPFEVICLIEALDGRVREAYVCGGRGWQCARSTKRAGCQVPCEFQGRNRPLEAFIGRATPENLNDKDPRIEGHAGSCPLTQKFASGTLTKEEVSHHAVEAKTLNT